MTTEAAMTTNIQETINRLRELDQKASPAPWARTGTKRFSYDDIEPGDLLDGEGFELVPEIERVCPPVDAEMIAEARNAIPTLLAEIERLTEENDKAWENGYADAICDVEGVYEIDRAEITATRSPYKEEK